MKREASFQTIFNKYLRASGLCGHFELKQTTGKSIRFDAVKPHQVAGLIAAGSKGFVWKYSDQDQRQKPFDCSSIPPLVGYVVVRFSQWFYIIKAADFLREKERSTRKSLTEERAWVIATRYVSLKKLSP